jgi:hypothetical protein
MPRKWALWVYIGGAVLLSVIVLTLMAAAEAKAKAGFLALEY